MPFTQLSARGPCRLGRCRLGRGILGPGILGTHGRSHRMCGTFRYRFADRCRSNDEDRGEMAMATARTTSTSSVRSVRNGAQQIRHSIDRYRNGTRFFGHRGCQYQDRAVQAKHAGRSSIGVRSSSPTDKAIIAMRRLLLQASMTVESGGDPPRCRRKLLHPPRIERICRGSGLA